MTFRFGMKAFQLQLFGAISFCRGATLKFHEFPFLAVLDCVVSHVLLSMISVRDASELIFGKWMRTATFQFQSLVVH